MNNWKLKISTINGNNWKSSTNFYFGERPRVQYRRRKKTQPFYLRMSDKEKMELWMQLPAGAIMGIFGSLFAFESWRLYSWNEGRYLRSMRQFRYLRTNVYILFDRANIDKRHLIGRLCFCFCIELFCVFVLLVA